MSEELKPAQTKTTILIVCILLGAYGIHRLMLGYNDLLKQLLWFLLCFPVGVVKVWIDLFKIIGGSLKMADGRDLV